VKAPVDATQEDNAVILARYLQKTSDAVDRVCTVITVILLGTMSIVTFLQIICRAFFTSLSWSEELARYMLIWLTFIGAGCVHKRAGHISITLFQNIFSGKTRKAFQILTQLLCIIVFAVAIYYGFSYMQLMGLQLSAAMRIPMRYIYAVIPLGGSVLLLHSVDRIVRICFHQEDTTK